MIWFYFFNYTPDWLQVQLCSSQSEICLNSSVAHLTVSSLALYVQYVFECIYMIYNMI